MATCWVCLRTFGHRLFLKLKMSGMTIMPDGTLQMQEFRGPPTWKMWDQGYGILSTDLIFLICVELGPLMAYRSKIAKLATSYEPRGLWHLIYQADCRMRHEHMERLRREGAKAKHINQNHEFDPAFPWRWVWMEATRDIQFWKSEFEDPALHVLTRIATLSSVVDGDVTISGSSSGVKRQAAGDDLYHSDAGVAKEPRRTPPPPPQQAVADKMTSEKERKGGGEDKSQQSVGRYTHNRKGKELCNLYNDGNCNTSQEGLCSKNPDRAHHCNLFLAVQPGCNCSKAIASDKKRGKGGKGRGR